MDHTRSPSSHYSPLTYTNHIMSIPHHSTHITALAAQLRAGVAPSRAAANIGITPSAVTQLVSTNPELVEMKEEQLKRSSQLDSTYDEIEESLLKQLKRTIPLLVRPQEIANVLTRINQAKRRGVAATDNSGPPTVLTLNLPTTIQNKFVVNSHNQVVTAGSQDLVTIPSGAVATLAKRNKPLLESPNDSQPTEPTILEEDEYGFTHPRTEATGE